MYWVQDAGKQSEIKKVLNIKPQEEMAFKIKYDSLPDDIVITKT